jgi:hypothetical protein
MNGAHVSGAGIGAVIGAILVSLFRRYSVAGITAAEAALIGAGCVAAGTGIAHAVWSIGLGPMCDRLLHGPKTAPPPVAAAPAPNPPQ